MEKSQPTPDEQELKFLLEEAKVELLLQLLNGRITKLEYDQEIERIIILLSQAE